MFDTVTAVSPWTVPAAQRTRLIGGALMVHLVAAAAYLAATLWSIAPVAPPDLGSVFVVEPAPPRVTFVEPARREPAARPATAGAPAEVAQPVAATVQPREIGELEPATPGLERIATLGGPEGSVAADGGTTGPVASGYGDGELSVPFRVGMTPPRILSRVDPLYPEVARRMRRQGTVVIEAEIGSDGRLRSARAVNAPLGAGLEEAALAALASWRFAPAEVQGRPVSVFYRLSVTFRLQ